MNDDRTKVTSLERAVHVLALVERIKPILAGQDAAVQGAAVAELVSLWLAGFSSPLLREALLDDHIKSVRALTAVNARRLHGEEHDRKES